MADQKKKLSPSIIHKRLEDELEREQKAYDDMRTEYVRQGATVEALRRMVELSKAGVTDEEQGGDS